MLKSYSAQVVTVQYGRYFPGITAVHETLREVVCIRHESSCLWCRPTP